MLQEQSRLVLDGDTNEYELTSTTKASTNLAIFINYRIPMGFRGSLPRNQWTMKGKRGLNLGIPIWKLVLVTNERHKRPCLHHGEKCVMGNLVTVYTYSGERTGPGWFIK